MKEWLGYVDKDNKVCILEFKDNGDIEEISHDKNNGCFEHFEAPNKRKALVIFKKLLIEQGE